MLLGLVVSSYGGQLSVSGHASAGGCGASSRWSSCSGAPSALGGRTPSLMRLAGSSSSLSHRHALLLQEPATRRMASGLLTQGRRTLVSMRGCSGDDSLETSRQVSASRKIDENWGNRGQWERYLERGALDHCEKLVLERCLFDAPKTQSEFECLFNEISHSQSAQRLLLNVASSLGLDSIADWLLTQDSVTSADTITLAIQNENPVFLHSALRHQSKGFDLNALLTDTDSVIAMPPLHHLVRTGSVAMVRELLEECAVDVDCVDETLATPLLSAVASKDYPMVSLLLEFGADPSLENCHGESALGIAVECVAAKSIYDITKSQWIVRWKPPAVDRVVMLEQLLDALLAKGKVAHNFDQQLYRLASCGMDLAKMGGVKAKLLQCQALASRAQPDNTFSNKILNQMPKQENGMPIPSKDLLTNGRSLDKGRRLDKCFEPIVAVGHVHNVEMVLENVIEAGVDQRQLLDWIERYGREDLEDLVRSRFNVPSTNL